MTPKLRQAGHPRLTEILTPETNSFGVLRLLMASLVLISHSYMYLAGTSAAEPLQPWLGRSLGECAVQVFFILSGLMVAQSFDRSRSVIDFAAARVLRIFPALIICVLLTAFVVGPLISDLPLRDYFRSAGIYTYVAKTVALTTGAAPLPEVFKDNPFAGLVNSSLWTLKYEVACYVGLACLGAAGLFDPCWRRIAIVGFAVLIATVALGLPADIETFGFLENLRYFTVFFGAGVLAYFVRRQLPIMPIVLLPLAVLFVIFVKTPLAELSSALFLGYAAICAATLRFGPLHSVCNRFDLSFGVYIFAGPTQQALIWLLPGLTPLWLTVLAFLIVAPIALVSWVLIEKPALGLKRAIATRSIKAAALQPAS